MGPPVGLMGPPAPPGPAGAAAPPPAEEQSITEILKNPTKVVLLRNMVGPGEVDEELEPETKEECGRYGEVVCPIVVVFVIILKQNSLIYSYNIDSKALFVFYQHQGEVRNLRASWSGCESRGGGPYICGV